MPRWLPRSPTGAASNRPFPRVSGAPWEISNSRHCWFRKGREAQLHARRRDAALYRRVRHRFAGRDYDVVPHGRRFPMVKRVERAAENTRPPYMGGPAELVGGLKRLLPVR